MRPEIPAKLAVPFFMIPVVIVLFVRPNEVADKTVRRCHVFAAGWFATLTILTEASSLIGYVPEGSALYRILMHLGWIHVWKVLKPVVRPKPGPGRDKFEDKP